MTRSALQTKHDVELALRAEPGVDDRRVSVLTDGGAVSLCGTVDSYPQSWRAERAAEKVVGRGLVQNGLLVRLRPADIRCDSELVDVIVGALRVAAFWVTPHPEWVTVEVRSGKVALGGCVQRQSEREGAEGATREITGVVGLVNAIACCRPLLFADADTPSGGESDDEPAISRLGGALMTHSASWWSKWSLS